MLQTFRLECQVYFRLHSVNLHFIVDKLNNICARLLHSYLKLPDINFWLHDDEMNLLLKHPKTFSYNFLDNTAVVGSPHCSIS
jgi:spore coat polysaccharide biosynthesis predicted glycosyltransferase SpsG